MIIYKKGDLLEATEDIIAHGVNCVGGFKSGVAGQLAEKYPRAKDRYLQKFNNIGWKLGENQLVMLPNNKRLYNCATQYADLPRGICHVDYAAIRRCMEWLKDDAESDKLSVAIPKIGCGLAGGDWDTVKAILEDVFQDYDVTVYEL